MVRQGLNVIRNLSHLSSEFLHAGLDFRRILLQLFEFERQHCEPLVDVVMKLSSNASAFLFLRFDQFLAHTQEVLFQLFTAGYILRKNENPSHSAFRGLPRTNLPACPMSAVLPIPTVFVGSQGFSFKGAGVNLFPALRHVWKNLIVAVPFYLRSAG